MGRSWCCSCGPVHFRRTRRRTAPPGVTPPGGRSHPRKGDRRPAPAPRSPRAQDRRVGHPHARRRPGVGSRRVGPGPRLSLVDPEEPPRGERRRRRRPGGRRLLRAVLGRRGRSAGGPRRRILSMEVPGVYNGTIILQGPRDAHAVGPLQRSGASRGRSPARSSIDSRSSSRTGTSGSPATRTRTSSGIARALARGTGRGTGPGKWGIVSEMGATLASLDPRLPENALVYGVEAGASAKAYPLSQVERRGRRGERRDRPGRRRRPGQGRLRSRGVRPAAEGAAPHLPCPPRSPGAT